MYIYSRKNSMVTDAFSVNQLGNYDTLENKESVVYC